MPKKSRGTKSGPNNRQRLDRSFYARSPIAVARELIGCRLYAQSEKGLVAGRIVESEAYLAQDDSACHAAGGPNRKNATMFEKPGLAYVYTIHARQCVNVVTEEVGVGSAVLIRAVEPIDGREWMQQRRARSTERDLTRGPARLCEAFGITRDHDGSDLVTGSQLWISDTDLDACPVHQSVRVGVTSAEHLPLRFFVPGNRYVSGPKWLNDQGSPTRS